MREWREMREMREWREMREMREWREQRKQRASPKQVFRLITRKNWSKERGHEKSKGTNQNKKMVPFQITSFLKIANPITLR